MDIQRVEYDRAAYEAFCNVWNENTDEELPSWEELIRDTPTAAKAWRAAANQVVRETIDWYREFLTQQQARMPL